MPGRVFQWHWHTLESPAGAGPFSSVRHLYGDSRSCGAFLGVRVLETQGQGRRLPRRIAQAFVSASTFQESEAAQDLSSHPVKEPGESARIPRGSGLPSREPRSILWASAAQSWASEAGLTRRSCARPLDAVGFRARSVPSFPPLPGAGCRYPNPPQNKESSHNRAADSQFRRARLVPEALDCRSCIRSNEEWAEPPHRAPDSNTY